MEALAGFDKGIGSFEEFEKVVFETDETLAPRKSSLSR